MELLTDRLRLRPFQIEDAPVHFEVLVRDPAVARHLPGGRPGTIENAERVTHAFVDHWQERGYGVWAVFLTETERFIGRCGLRYLPEIDEVELLYALAPEYWGAGYATEAAQASVRFGFEHVGLDEIVGLVLPENLASAKVLKKCRMRDEGSVEIFGLTVLQLRVTEEEFAWPGGRYELGLSPTNERPNRRTEW